MRKLGIICALLAGCLWGSIGTFVRFFNSIGIDGSGSVALRALFSFIIFFFIIIIKDRSLFKVQKKDIWLVILTGFGCGFGINLLYNIAILSLTLSLAAVLLSTMPIFVIIFSAFIFKEKITKIKLISMILVFAGCILVSGVIEGGVDKISLLGVMFGLLSGIGYAIYSICAKALANRGYNQFTTNFYTFVIAFIIFSFFTDWGRVGEFIIESPIKNILFLILHSLIGSVLPYICYSLSMKYLEAGIASIFASVEPVAAMLFGAFLQNEIPTAITISGLILVILAVAILGIADRKAGAIHEQN